MVRASPLRDIAPSRYRVGLALLQRCFAAFGDLQGIMTHRRDVKRDIERQKICQGIDRHAVRHQR